MVEKMRYSLVCLSGRPEKFTTAFLMLSSRFLSSTSFLRFDIWQFYSFFSVSIGQAKLTGCDGMWCNINCILRYTVLILTLSLGCRRLTWESLRVGLISRYAELDWTAKLPVRNLSVPFVHSETVGTTAELYKNTNAYHELCQVI